MTGGTSLTFRTMLRQMNLFWGLPALLLGAEIIMIVWIYKVEQTIAYELVCDRHPLTT